MTLTNRKNRRAYSLIETLVATSMTTLLVGLAAGLIHVALQGDRQARARLTEDAGLARLASTFRDDVRAASAAEARPDAGLALTVPGGTMVEYAIQNGRVARVVNEGGKVRRRDAFALPTGSSARWERFDDGGRPFVVFASERPAADNRPASPSIRIEAALGADRRFLAGEGPR